MTRHDTSATAGGGIDSRPRRLSSVDPALAVMVHCERSMTVDAGYTLLEHTADAGVIAWGPTPSEAFAQAARAMVAIMLGADPSTWRSAGRRITLEVMVAGQDWDDLLVNWLAQLLFHVEVDHCIPQRITFAQCAPPRCTAWIEGFTVERPDALAGVGIKAVTYHQLDVRITPDRTDVRVIFDI